MRKIYSFNFLSRTIFLLLTPVFFHYFAIGFIWHSIYWGVITFVLFIWLLFILLSPLIGRIGCGWFCFMGTTIDFAGKHSIFKTKWKKPKIWVRLLILVPFLISSFTFYFINKSNGITHEFNFLPGFLKPTFDTHYKIVWTADISAAIILGLFLDKRWACKNLCFMGALCSAGAHYSRFLPVIDVNKCNKCLQCEKVCLVGIPMTDYIESQRGLVTNSECILCGKCIDICKKDAIQLKFIWNRKTYKRKVSEKISIKHNFITN